MGAVDSNYLMLGAFIIFLLASVGAVIVLWIALPFSVFGMKDLLRKLIAEQEKTNKLLKTLVDSVHKESVYRPGEDFAATLESVKKSVEPQKERYFGLGMMIGFWLMGVGQPYFLPKFVMRNTFVLGVKDGNLPPAFTNMGPIERESCRDWGKTPDAAFLGVPTARPPWFAVGMSGYGGSLSLSAGFYPSAIAPERIEALFDAMEAELEKALKQA